MKERLKRALGIGFDGSKSGDFPPAIPRQRARFNIGDTVIVTSNCEDIGLHGLTGTVVGLPRRTSAYDVQIDADASILSLLPEEIGHHF